MKTSVRGRRLRTAIAAAVLLVPMVLLGLAGESQAASAFVSVDVDTTLGGHNAPADGTLIDVRTFDMSPNGASMVIGGMAALDAIPSPGLVGLVAPILYQANLVGFVDPANNSLATPKLNSGAADAYEVTGVSSLTATVVSDVTVPGVLRTITLLANPGGLLDLLYDDYNTPAHAGQGTKAVVGPGTGFADGHLVLSGAVHQGTINITLTPPPPGATSGTGSANVDLLVVPLSCNASGTFFATTPPASGRADCAPPGLVLHDIHFEGTLTFPFPSPPGPVTTFFAGSTLGFPFIPTPVTPADLVLKNDGNLLFTAAEPGALVLLGMGLLGVAGVSRFRRKK